MATHKILVADADAELRSVLALHLRNEEYEVVCARDGFEALTAAQREDPDVLLINVALSLDDDSNLYDELIDHPALTHIPIICLVGERTVRLGGVPRLPAESVIFKPVPTTELFRKIELAVTGAATGRPDLDFYGDQVDDNGADIARDAADDEVADAEAA